MTTPLLTPTRPSDSATARSGAAPGPAEITPLEVSMLADIVAGLAAAEPLWRPHVTHDADDRTRLRLLATPAYEVWLLGWAPGQSVGLHDHGDANGAFVVVDGWLAERTLTSAGIVTESLRAGGIGKIPIGSVHDVANRSSQLATSIHAYSRPLTAMGFYGADGTLVRTEAVHEQSALVSSSDAARALHPAWSERT
jgi:predicted metal-dependent enzyme (double-stranded beta helix superfamily)